MFPILQLTLSVYGSHMLPNHYDYQPTAHKYESSLIMLNLNSLLNAAAPSGPCNMISRALVMRSGLPYVLPKVARNLEFVIETLKPVKPAQAWHHDL